MKLSETKHPMQPIGFDDHGVARFKANTLVRYLVDQLPGSLNAIARMNFPPEDQEQLAQLIGYSVSGAGELEYFSPERLTEADAEVARISDSAREE